VVAAEAVLVKELGPADQALLSQLLDRLSPATNAISARS
jgi:hypothetical protein